jgi:putative hydrolase of the HAD superfamily
MTRVDRVAPVANNFDGGRVSLPRVVNQPVKYLIWDFDGTLGFRAEGWSAMLLRILRDEFPLHPGTVEEIRPTISSGFPWHQSHRPHLHLATSVDWWGALDPVFVNTFRSLGVDRETAVRLAGRVRVEYPDVAYWRLFVETRDALEELTGLGWKHLLLTNHVPELPGIIEGLGIARHFETVYNSAATGYEKPHPEAWREIKTLLAGGADVWMIGDNLQADIRGAEQVGLRTILVRSWHKSCHCCQDLRGIRAIVELP